MSCGMHMAGPIRGAPKGVPCLPVNRFTSNMGVRGHYSFVDRRGGHQVSRPVVTFFKTESTSTDEQRDDITSASENESSWEIRLLFDGDCALCMREVTMLRERDAGVGKIQFVDIADPDYSPEENAGVTYEEAMGHIHGILPDGSVVTSIEVFRRCYEAVGLGWVYAATKFEPIRKAAEAAYSVWAKYRLPITGRGDLNLVLEKRRDQIDEMGCGETSESCELPWAVEEDESKK